MAVVLKIVSFLLGACWGESMAINRWQTEAVKHGAAHYNPQTAAFEWNDQPREVKGE
jgi:hypothetical protein